MKNIIIVFVNLLLVVVILGLFGISASNSFKDKLSHIEMLRQTIIQMETPLLNNETPQALRMYEREKNKKEELIYAFNLEVAEYNSMANRFPYSIFRGSYPTIKEQYYAEK